MSLPKVWTRQLYEAWGVALLVPAAVIAALLVLALGGGFGGLGALGQLVSGPAVPAGSALSAAVTPGVRGGHRGAGLLPVVPAAPLARRHVTASAVVSGRTSAPPVQGGTGVSSPARGRTGSGIGSGGRSAAPPPVKPPPSSTPPAPTPTPTPTAPLPALVNQVVAVGVSVTSKLPGPLGQLGTGVLQSLGQTLDSLLTPPS
jgi:hypothetical protein